ncbi:MAG: hypothetical protein RBU21_24855 [FCB group bacterium]|jgi:hypothetical protein|nr:hypothetical protein [FCB group bacterium]
MAREDNVRWGKVRFALKWAFRAAVAVVLILAVVFVIVFWSALRHRFVDFPRQAKGWEKVRESRQEVALDDGWTEYRGVCHSHSELSHDSEVPFPEVLEAAKQADVSFLFMSDHCTDSKADYSKQWKGLHDGILFVRGFEMKEGFMPWGLPDDTVLDSRTEPAELAAQIEKAGGLLFFAHTEEPREWQLPELDGMEIYNIHTDFKNVGWGQLLPDILLSYRSYPDQVIRTVYEHQTDILKNWDELNRSRKITGIGANDCHQNNGVRAFYTDRDTVSIQTTAPDSELKELKLNFLTRTLFRLFPGPLTPGTQIFRVDLDPYERFIRFTNTHMLAKELTEPALLDALKQGRVFVAFDMIADARGFVFLAEAADGTKAVMGESIPQSPGLKLKASAPYEVRFTLIRNGLVEAEETGRTFEFVPQKPGKYRIEADLNVNGEWVDWLFTNPLEVAMVLPAPNAA